MEEILERFRQIECRVITFLYPSALHNEDQMHYRNITIYNFDFSILLNSTSFWG